MIFGKPKYRFLITMSIYWLMLGTCQARSPITRTGALRLGASAVLQFCVDSNYMQPVSHTPCPRRATWQCTGVRTSSWQVKVPLSLPKWIVEILSTTSQWHLATASSTTHSWYSFPSFTLHAPLPWSCFQELHALTKQQHRSLCPAFWESQTKTTILLVKKLRFREVK